VRLFTQDQKVEALRRAPLFSELSKKELTQLARMSEDLELDAGTVLCREGGFGAEFFVLVEGEVEVTRRGKPVKRAGGDEFFGEIALLENIARTATVTAKTPLRLFVLTSREFSSLVAQSPSVERKVMRSLARRLLEMSNDPALG
jgi:CRP-like cAMP-binding protein